MILIAAFLGLIALCFMRRNVKLRTPGSSRPSTHVSVRTLPKRSSPEQGDGSPDSIDSSALSGLAGLHKTVKFTLEELKFATDGFRCVTSDGIAFVCVCLICCSFC